jgi:type I restriction enzyme, S subunit
MKAGWRMTRLGDVCEIVKGRKPALRATSTNGDLPYLVAKVMRGSKEAEYASVRDRNSVTVQESDTIIICDGSNSGEIFTGFRGILSSTMGKLLKKAEINDNYLRTFLVSTFEVFNGGKTGAAIPHLDKEAMYQLEFPFPPLPEQERLVRILGKASESIGSAKANTERSLQNARDLFESHLQSVFGESGREWERVSLGTLLERGWIEGHLDGNHGSDYPRKEEFVGNGVPYISANCLDDHDRLDMSRAKYLSPARAALLRKGIARNNDVLFAHNATVGPVTILRTDEERVILGTSLTYYRCNPTYLLPEYLAHYMRSFGFKKQYVQVMRQSTRNQVPITTQRDFVHVIPPLAEQRRLVAVLDELLDSTQDLARLYERKLIALEALKKSLLHKAFAGEL